MLELAILGLLKEQDLHGYELKKRLSETLGMASGVSFGSLYPALGRLERAGALRTVDQAFADSRETRPAIPLTGSLGGELAVWRARAAGSRPATTRAGSGHGGRSRKVYGITPKGEELFEGLLAAEQSGGDDSRLFRLRLAFARHLSADARLRMLERRRTHLVDRLTRAGATGRPGRRVDGYLRSLMDHDRETTEHDLSWIEHLIAGERGSPMGMGRTERTGAPSTTGPPDLTGPPEGAPAQDAAGSYRVAPPTLSGLRPGTASQSAGADGPDQPGGIV